MKFLTILLILISNFSFSQNWTWINYLQGGSSNHTFYDIEISNDQNFVYGVGRYRNPATFYGQDFDLSPYHAGYRDVFLAKIDTSGNYEWIVTEGGISSDYAEGVTTDEFDNVYVVGTTRDSAYFDNTGILSDVGGDVFVAKYDSDGNFIWVKNFGGDDWDYAKEVECDKNGHIYIAGLQTGNFDYGDGILTDAGYFIAKMDYDGNFVWCEGPQNNANNSASTIMSLKYKNDKIYFGGRIRSDVNFGDVNVVGHVWEDMIFGCMDTSGYTNWVRSAGGIYFTDCQDLFIADNAIYVAGSYGGDVMFDTIPMSSVALSSGGQSAYDCRDAYVAKYTLDGSSCLWVRDVKSTKLDQHYNVILDKENNVVVTGGYAEDDIYSQTISQGDLKIIAYDTAGNYVWEMFPQGLRKAEGFLIKQDDYGNYYLGGRIKGDYTFNDNISIPVPGGKFTGIIGKIYPRLNPAKDSITACTNDSIWISIPSNFGSPLVLDWYYDNNLSFNINNDSIFTTINNIDSIYCVINNGIISDTAVFAVTENTLPYFSLGSDTITCDFNSSIELIPSQLFNGDLTWSTNETNETILVNSSGEYWLSQSNDNSCEFSDTINVSFIDCMDIIQNIENSGVNIILSNNNTINIIQTENELFKINVFNMSGSLILSGNNEKSIYVGNLIPGSYILNYSSNQNTNSVFKFIIK
jgi:hypothetical protein